MNFDFHKRIPESTLVYKKTRNFRGWIGPIKPPPNPANNPTKAALLNIPAGPVVKNPPANAGGMGLIPSVGGFHMQEEQLNLKPDKTTEPTHPRAWAL